LHIKYLKSLQVIAVTDEAEKRADLQMKSKLANFWFAIDTGRTMTKVSALADSAFCSYRT
jgi:hypothetical protein